MFTLPPKPFIDDPESPAAKRRAGADESASSEQKRNSAARVFPQKSETDEPWSTGSELTDRWIIDNHVDPAVLEKFALLPKMNRKRIILKCIETPVQNPDAWITACVRNWQTNETEQRLTRAANQTGGMMSTVAVPREGFQPYSASTSGHFSSPHKEAVSTEFPVPGLELFKVISNPVCQKMMTMWPDHKSDFISTFLSCVDDTTADRITALSPQDQVGLAFCFMMNASADDAAYNNRLVNVWLQRMEAMRGMTISSSCSPSKKVLQHGTSISVQFVLGGMPTVMAGTLMSVLFLTLPRMHPNVKWNFLPVLHLSDDCDDQVQLADVASCFGVHFLMECTSLQMLSEKFPDWVSGWETMQAKFVFIANVGFIPSPSMILTDISPDFLHGGQNRWVWKFLQATTAVRQRFGNETLADIIFAPAAEALAADLTRLWGAKAKSGGTLQTPPFVQEPCVHSTPSGFAVTPVIENDAQNKENIGHWDCPDMCAWVQKHGTLCTSPSYLSKLLVVKLFKERPLQKQEQEMLQVRVSKHIDGTVRGIGRDWFLRWFGFLDTPGQSLLQQHLPCLGDIIITTGMPGTSNARFTSACGQQRYCRNCERVFEMLDQSYATYTLADVLLALMTKTVLMWSGTGMANKAEWVRDETLQRMHTCDADCALSRAAL